METQQPVIIDPSRPTAKFTDVEPPADGGVPRE